MTPESGTTPTLNNAFPPAFDYSAAFAQGLVQAQRVQLETLVTWQRSLAAINQELWDEWAVHWAGGAPIGV